MTMNGCPVSESARDLPTSAPPTSLSRSLLACAQQRTYARGVMKTATPGAGLELAAEWKAPLPISNGEYHRCACFVGMWASCGFTSSGGERRMRGGDWVSANLGKRIMEASQVSGDSHRAMGC